MRKAFLALVAFCALAFPALAQQELPQDIPFEGGKLTIAEDKDTLEKVLTFDGAELARNYLLYYNRTVEVSGKQVALFDIGDGGTACSSSVMMVWKPEGSNAKADIAGEDCGSPPALTGYDSIFFVPYMMPGATRPLQAWSPDKGFRLAGMLSFTPQPNTGWGDLDPTKLDNIVDAFGNAAVYVAAQKMLGDEIEQFATGLLVGGGAEVLPSGIFWSSGCVPHACGSFDAFMAVDAKGKKLYLAQQQDSGETRTWPALKDWPKDVEEAARSVIPMPQ